MSQVLRSVRLRCAACLGLSMSEDALLSAIVPCVESDAVCMETSVTSHQLASVQPNKQRTFHTGLMPGKPLDVHAQSADMKRFSRSSGKF